MQFTQKRLFNWNRYISASIDPWRLYEGLNWRFGRPLFIDTCLRLLFYIWSRAIQKNLNFIKINEKWQSFIKTRISVESMPKQISFLRIYILIFLQNLKATATVCIELSRKKKLTTYTHKHTRTHTRYA